VKVFLAHLALTSRDINLAELESWLRLHRRLLVYLKLAEIRIDARTDALPFNVQLLLELSGARPLVFVVGHHPGYGSAEVLVEVLRQFEWIILKFPLFGLKGRQRNICPFIKIIPAGEHFV